MPKVESKRPKVKSSSRPKPYAMTEVDQQTLQVFLSTGRTGRRNAMVDVIQDKCGKSSTAGLPEALDSLCCADGASSTADKDSTSADKTSSSNSSKDSASLDKTQEKTDS